MRIVFAGTPAFAVPTLDALLNAHHSIAAVYTQPDRPAGRGRRVTPSAIKRYAVTRGVPIHQPATLRDAADSVAALRPDVMIVVAYGLILPPAILAVPRFGCINVHASLLPRWRGAAPIARAIEAGDAETGGSVMQMAAGLDTGPVLAQARTPIGIDDTAGRLEDRLARLGAEILVATLPRLERGEIDARPQDASRACYAPKIQTGEAMIDWRQSAAALQRKIRAFNPRPVARTLLRGDAHKLWEAALPEPSRSGIPGTILQADATGIRVATADGVLVLTRVQAPGGKPLSAAEFLNGRRLVPGERFGV